MACDIRIASENAKFGQPEVNLGILPGYGGTQRMTRLLGEGTAMYLCLTGEMIDAHEALRVGLVQRVVPLDGLLAEAQRIAELIAAKGAARDRRDEARDRRRRLALARGRARARSAAVRSGRDDRRLPRRLARVSRQAQARFHGR